MIETFLDIYMPLYLEYAPHFFQSEEWGFLLALMLLGLSAQICLYLIRLSLKRITDIKKRGIAFTSLVSFLMGCGFFYYSYVNGKLNQANVIAAGVLVGFVFLLGFLPYLFPKLGLATDLDANLKLRESKKSNGMCSCPSCKKKTIAQMNVMRGPQTCGECGELISINQKFRRSQLLYFSLLGLIPLLGIILKINFGISRQIFVTSLFVFYFFVITVYLVRFDKMLQQSLLIINDKK